MPPDLPCRRCGSPGGRPAKLVLMRRSPGKKHMDWTANAPTSLCETCLGVLAKCLKEALEEFTSRPPRR